MKIPIVYRISRFFIRAALAVYFKGIEVAGARYAPQEGPVVFAANHPHSIVDSFVLGAAAGRMLHFLGHSGLFNNPLKAWFLRSAGVIPIYRRTGEGDVKEKNRAAFAVCTETLSAGGAIGIFPEGTSHLESRVIRIKTGTARIALQAEAEHDFRLGVRIIPAGLSFESKGRFRSRVLVRFGEPLDVAYFEDLWHDDPVEAVNRLTESVESGIRAQIRSLSRPDLEQLVKDIEATYKEELAEKRGFGVSKLSKFKKDRFLRREIARAVDYYFRKDPHAVWDVEREFRRYRGRLEQLRISDEQLRGDESPGLRREAAKIVTIGLLGLIPALFGAGMNGIPYKLTGWAAKRVAPDPTQFHQFQILFGALFYFLYYPPLLWGIFQYFERWPATFVGLALAPAGFFARWYAHRMTRSREAFRFARLSATRGYVVKNLRHQRRRIVQTMDRLLEQYLKDRPEPSESEEGASN